MKIQIITPNSLYKTIIDTESSVVIEEPYAGPILKRVENDLNVAIFARDDGFEGHIWQGDFDSSTVKRFRIDADGEIRT